MSTKRVILTNREEQLQQHRFQSRLATLANIVAHAEIHTTATSLASCLSQPHNCVGTSTQLQKKKEESDTIFLLYVPFVPSSNSCVDKPCHQLPFFIWLNLYVTEMNQFVRLINSHQLHLFRKKGCTSNPSSGREVPGVGGTPSLHQYDKYILFCSSTQPRYFILPCQISQTPTGKCFYPKTFQKHVKISWNYDAASSCKN